MYSRERKSSSSDDSDDSKRGRNQNYNAADITAGLACYTKLEFLLPSIECLMNKCNSFLEPTQMPKFDWGAIGSLGDMDRHFLSTPFNRPMNPFAQKLIESPGMAESRFIRIYPSHILSAMQFPEKSTATREVAVLLFQKCGKRADSILEFPVEDIDNVIEGLRVVKFRVALGIERELGM